MPTKKFLFLSLLGVGIFYIVIFTSLLIYSRTPYNQISRNTNIPAILPTDEYIFFTRDETTSTNKFSRVGEGGDNLSTLHEWKSEGFSLDNFTLSPSHTQIAWSESFFDAYFLNLESKETEKVSFGAYKEYGFINTIFWRDDSHVIIEATDPHLRDGSHYFYTYVIGVPDSIKKVDCTHQPYGNYIDPYFHAPNNKIFFVDSVDTRNIYQCDINTGETILAFSSPYESISQLSINDSTLIIEIQYLIPGVQYHVGSHYKYVLFNTNNGSIENVNINELFKLKEVTQASLLFNDELGDCVYEYLLDLKSANKIYCYNDQPQPNIYAMDQKNFSYIWNQDQSNPHKGNLFRYNALNNSDKTIQDNVPPILWSVYLK